MKENRDAKKMALQKFYEYCVNHAYSEDPTDDFMDVFLESSGAVFFNTMKILLWTVDTRNGLGTDKFIKEALQHIVESPTIKTGFRVKFMDAVSKLGRWDILVNMIQYKISAKVRTMIYQKIERCIESGNTNCAKAMPRRGTEANRIRGFMKLSPKEWRNKLVPLCSKQLVALMSANKWSEIDYSALPTYLIVTYYNAFKKHDKDRFVEYLRLNPARSVTVSRILKKKLVRKPPATLTAVLAMQYMPDTIAKDKGGKQDVRSVRK